MDFPPELKYSREHEWVRVEGDRARVGITDFAQDALGDVVYVQLPEVGRSVTANESCAEIESTKSVSDVYSPVSGSIAEVNTELEHAPERVNAEPYGSGWLFVLEMSAGAELDDLLDAAAYRELVEEQ